MLCSASISNLPWTQSRNFLTITNIFVVHYKKTTQKCITIQNNHVPFTYLVVKHYRINMQQPSCALLIFNFKTLISNLMNFILVL